MKKVVFIVSHLASKSEGLLYLLNNSNKVDIRPTNISYAHPTDLELLFKRKHKCRSSAAIYGDYLIDNFSFYCKQLHDLCDFIYMIRSGKETMNELKYGKPYDPETSYLYYSFRLRRIYEMAKHTPRALLITLQDLKNEKELTPLEAFLKLKTPLPKFNKSIWDSNSSLEVPSQWTEKAQDCFEYYLYKLKNIPHLVTL